MLWQGQSEAEIKPEYAGHTSRGFSFIHTVWSLNYSSQTTAGASRASTYVGTEANTFYVARAAAVVSPSYFPRLSKMMGPRH